MDENKFVTPDNLPDLSARVTDSADDAPGKHAQTDQQVPGSQSSVSSAPAPASSSDAEGVPPRYPVEEREKRFRDAFALPHHKERAEAKKRALEVMKGYFRIRSNKAAPLNAFGKTLLEIGCGLGFGLRVYQDYGWYVFGTEISPTAYEYSRQQMLEVKHGAFPEVGFGNTKFDLVVLPEGLGDFADPNALTEGIKAVLAPSGLVCIVAQDKAKCLALMKGAGFGAIDGDTKSPMLWFEMKRKHQ